MKRGLVWPIFNKKNIWVRGGKESMFLTNFKIAPQLFSEILPSDWFKLVT